MNLKDIKVSDIMKGNFASIEIPAIEIPGSKPLIYTKAKDLIAEITAKDEFFIDDIEEEFLMFTAEMCDRNIRKQYSPHSYYDRAYLLHCLLFDSRIQNDRLMELK